MTKRKGLLIGVVVLALASLAFTVPAGAAVRGAGYFSCIVDLPIWPTNAGPPVSCVGTSSGQIVADTTSGQRVILAARGDSFSGNAFGYSERCTANEPLNGSASGQTVITGLQAGSTGVTGTGISNFVWTRIGVTAVIALPPGGGVFLSNGQVATQNGTGRAVAAFRPVSPATGRTCTAPGPLRAQIIGVAVWAG